METNLTILCQPDSCKSCGACCGLYNYIDSSYSSLQKRLRTRTALFHDEVAGAADVQEYSKKILSREDPAKRYEVIYCCEYLGFLDHTEKRVGCLLHPLQNSGLDLRHVSFYGQELCAGHICPSHYFIPQNQAQILIKIIDDWYLYGLCLTDIDLVTTYFRLIADRVGQELKPGVFDQKQFKDIAHNFFYWKINWPFRSVETNRLSKYYFDGSQYMISHIDYEKLGRPASLLDKIFLSLTSEFKSNEEVTAAEKLIEDNINEFVALYHSFF